jgi:hypothetical protein
MRTLSKTIKQLLPNISLINCKKVLLCAKIIFMSKVIINAKGTKQLKEAIRVVAFNQGHSNSSKTIVEILESNPLISKELRRTKKKVA